MYLEEEYFNSFTKSSFEILVRCLEEQGFVIDSKEEYGISFSCMQIKHMGENMFNKLCKKFIITTEIEFSKTGHFYQEHGAYSIIFNADDYDYESARKKLDKYVEA
mgnify:CR=1 FL=1